MSNEEKILERLAKIEAQLAPMAESAKGLKELKNDLMLVAHPASQMLIKQLEEVESSFQLEDLMELTKRLLRSVKNITFALNQLENIVDFVKTIEPLLKTIIPQLISYLDDLEQKGVFRIINATLDIRAKIADTYNPERLDRIGDGLVALLGFAEKISNPQAKVFFEKFADIPAGLDLSKSKDVGPFGLLSACSSREAKQGLGVLVELTKAMGSLKTNEPAAFGPQTGAPRE